MRQESLLDTVKLLKIGGFRSWNDYLAVTIDIGGDTQGHIERTKGTHKVGRLGDLIGCLRLGLEGNGNAPVSEAQLIGDQDLPQRHT